MRRYAEEVIALEPDLFVLTGDYVTNTSAFLPDCLEEMARVRARYGTFAVLGNHDHWYVPPGELTALFRESGIPLTIVRPFNIYGERYAWVGNASQAIPMLVKKVLDGDDPVVIWGSGAQKRNYLHAIDCADAMAGLVESGFVGTVNIGTEETVTLQELVETICRLAGKRPRIVTDRSKPEGRRIKSADASLLRRSYPGFQRNITLEAGLKRMLGWYENTFGSRAA